MHFIIIPIFVALALPVTNCEATLSALNITAPEGKFSNLYLKYYSIFLKIETNLNKYFKTKTK